MNDKYKVARKVLIAFACIVGMSVGVYIIAYPYVTNPIYWNEYSYHTTQNSVQTFILTYMS